jgi:uncharacterized protein DUF6228
LARLDGVKDWSDLEGTLTIKAGTDGRGHVVLRIQMDDHVSGSRLKGEVMVEAGQLDPIAIEAASLFVSR